MTRGRRAAPALVLSALLAATLAAAEPAPWAGLTLLEALERLRADGLNVIYSTDLVRPDMRVLAEPPRGATRRAMLDGFLAPYGLEARDGPGGAVLVVRVPAPGSLAGSVVDSVTGRPVAEVEVRVPAAGVRAATGEDGRFDVQGLHEGTWTVETRRVGYTPRRLDVSVSAGVATEIRIELARSASLAESVLVTGSGARATVEPADPAERLDRSELQPAPIGGDALRALAPAAGIAGDEQSSRLYVRGGVDDEVQVILDGLELYEPFHLPERQGTLSVIDAESVGGIAVHGGGFPSQYGGRMSGVVEIESSEPGPGKSATVQAGSEGFRAAGQGSFGRGSWLVSGRGGDPSTVLDALGVDPAYRPRYFDLLGKVELRLGERTRLRFNALGALDELEGPHDEAELSDDEVLRSTSGQRYGWIGVERLVTPRVHVATLLASGRLGMERTGSGAEFTELRDRRTTELLGIKQDWIVSLDRQVLRFGLDLKFLEAGYRYRAVPEDPSSAVGRAIDLGVKGRDVALYVSDRIRIGSGVEIEVGSRWSHQNWTPEGTEAAPRVNVAWRPSGRTVVRAAWGYFYQPQRVNELQVEDGVTGFFRAQRAEHRVVDFEREVGPAKVRISAYDKYMTRLRPRFENLFDPFAFFPETQVGRVRIVPSSARSRGLELGVRGATRRWPSWWASAAWASAEDRVDGRDVPRAWDQRLRISWGVVARPADDWELSLVGAHATGRPVTEVTAVEAMDPNGDVVVVPEFGPRNGRRLPVFHRLDLSATRTLHVRGTEPRVSVGVANLLDRDNVCCLAVASEASEDEPLVRELPGMARLVTWGLSWRF